MYSLEAMAALRMADKMESRKHLEDWVQKHSQEEILAQYDSGDFKEIKVTKYRDEDDCYNELWVTPEGKYVVRATEGLPCWYHVSDPLGYCERDHIFNDSTVFLVCDKDWNPLFGCSNLNSEFPTVKHKCREEWERVKSECTHIDDETAKTFWPEAVIDKVVYNVDDWLLSFKDPDKYRIEIEEMNGIDDNWTMFRKELLSKEPVSTFKFLGEDYAIFRLHYRHKVCGVEWDEYLSGRLHMKEWESYIDYYASNFDMQHCGDFYSKRAAIHYIHKALREIYPQIKEKFDTSERLGALSEIHEYEWDEGRYYERKHSYYDAAVTLLKDKDYRRDHVAALAKKEEKKHSFIRSNDPELKTLYPNLERDYSFGYQF